MATLEKTCAWSGCPRHRAGRYHRGHQDQPPSPGRAGAGEFSPSSRRNPEQGIVRGYAGAVGLDQHDWTERFLKACNAAGQATDDERSWTAFAFNVAKPHPAPRRRGNSPALVRRDSSVIAVAAAAFLSIRYFGLRAHWWPPCCPWKKSAPPPHPLHPRPGRFSH